MWRRPESHHRSKALKFLHLLVSATLAYHQKYHQFSLAVHAEPTTSSRGKLGLWRRNDGFTSGMPAPKIKANMYVTNLLL
jgi:hypothetical protein